MTFLRRFRDTRGFTLFELVVVIGVTLLLTTAIFTFSSSSRSQIALFTETAKISQIIARAKSLTLSSYASGASECGFGVHFDYASNKIELVSFTAADCSAISIIPALAVKESFTLNSELDFEGGANRISTVFFTAPDPTTIQDLGGTLFTDRTGNIYLTTKDGSASAKISVNPGGQISF